MNQSAAEFASLSLTVPTVLLSIWVCAVYGRTAMLTLRDICTGVAVSDRHLLLLGITVGFGGHTLDNLYWFAAWFSKFKGLPSEEFLFSHGSFPNIFFRQTAGILAAYMHLYAAYVTVGVDDTSAPVPAGFKVRLLALACVFFASSVALILL